MIENENIISMLCFAICEWVVARDWFAVAKRLLTTDTERE
jgi:hypothetical protein